MELKEFNTLFPVRKKNLFLEAGVNLGSIPIQSAW
jgi:hypothetical protein